MGSEREELPGNVFRKGRVANGVIIKEDSCSAGGEEVVRKSGYHRAVRPGGRTKEERNAQDENVFESSKMRLGFQLLTSVGVQGLATGGFVVGRVGTVEDVIGGDVDERDPERAEQSRKLNV